MGEMTWSSWILEWIPAEREEDGILDELEDEVNEVTCCKNPLHIELCIRCTLCKVYKYALELN